jgi:hypothetical protein
MLYHPTQCCINFLSSRSYFIRCTCSNYFIVQSSTFSLMTCICNFCLIFLFIVLSATFFTPSADQKQNKNLIFEEKYLILITMWKECEPIRSVGHPCHIKNPIHQSL